MRSKLFFGLLTSATCFLAAKGADRFDCPYQHEAFQAYSAEQLFSGAGTEFKNAHKSYHRGSNKGEYEITQRLYSEYDPDHSSSVNFHEIARLLDEAWSKFFITGDDKVFLSALMLSLTSGKQPVVESGLAPLLNSTNVTKEVFARRRVLKLQEFAAAVILQFVKDCTFGSLPHIKTVLCAMRQLTDIFYGDIKTFDSTSLTPLAEVGNIMAKMASKVGSVVQFLQHILVHKCDFASLGTKWR
jgi:hypothetical protein